MPYVFVTTQVRLESGPSRIGDSESDPELMQYLEAELVHDAGNTFAYWVTQLKPRRVLDLLDGRGYKLVGTTGIGQTYVATLYKEEEDKDKKN